MLCVFISVVCAHTYTHTHYRYYGNPMRRELINLEATSEKKFHLAGSCRTSRSSLDKGAVVWGV